MRGRGPIAMKGKQAQISLYLPLPQYWLLRATSKRSGFSMQYLLRRALEEVLKDSRRYPFGETQQPRRPDKTTV
jgi:hypothetical protein